MELTNEQTLLIHILKKYARGEIVDDLHDIINELDWGNLLDLTLEHRVFPIVYYHLMTYIPDNYKEVFRNIHLEFILLTNNKIASLTEIIKSAKAAKIHTVVVKGLPLTKAIYSNLYLREDSDIDVLVYEKDMMKMDEIMLRLNYSRDIGNEEINKFYSNSLVPIYRHSTDYHELNYVKMINFSNIHVEIKRGASSIYKKFITNFLESTSEVNISQCSLNTLDFNHTFLLLCANTYENTEQSLLDEKRIKLRDYFDIVTFLQKFHQKMNWESIIDLANKYHMLHRLIYVFSNLRDIDYELVDLNILRLLNDKYITYDYVGYDHYGLVNWQNTFTERLFGDPDDVKEEFYRLLNQRFFSSVNLNYSQPAILNTKEQDATDFFVFNENVKFSFSVNETDFTLKILLSNPFFNKTGIFSLVFTIIEENIHFEKYIIVKKSNNEFEYKINQTNVKRGTFDELKKGAINNVIEHLEGKVINISFPLTELNLGDFGHLCFNFGINVEVLPGYFQSIGKYHNSLNPGLIKILN